MSFWGLMLVAGVLAVIYRYVLDSALEETPRRWFLGWVLRGLLMPFVLWLVCNLNLDGWTALMPEVSVEKLGSRKWLRAVLDTADVGLVVIATFWGAVTFGWLMAVSFWRATDRTACLVKAAIMAAMAFPIAVFVLYSFAWCGLGAALMCLLGPAAFGQLSVQQPLAPQPGYARAVAKIKLGKFDEAELEVLTELERFETDFEGWMMLAALYTEHFGELDEADRTVRELCDQPDMTVSQVSVALQRLADWHLKFGDDPAPARAALEELCRRIPQGHLARMAHQRLARLPTTSAELRASRQVRKISLQPTTPHLTSLALTEEVNLDHPAQVKRSEQVLLTDPGNIAERERLALLQAQDLKQAEQAIESFQTLLDAPGQPETKLAEWLGRMAVLQLRFLHDATAARATWQRIVHEFPQSPHAFTAQRRLSLLAMEEKMRQCRAARAK